jgi:hypothetical protein
MNVAGPRTIVLDLSRVERHEKADTDSSDQAQEPDLRDEDPLVMLQLDLLHVCRTPSASARSRYPFLRCS